MGYYDDGPDFDIDELTPGPVERENAGCVSCGRDWYGPAADECPPCRAAGGAPVACFQCGSAMRWQHDLDTREPVAECDGRRGCDARYPLAVVRTFRLGQLVERIVAETETGSAAEVGRMILAAGRTSLRRVQ